MSIQPFGKANVLFRKMFSIDLLQKSLLGLHGVVESKRGIS